MAQWLKRSVGAEARASADREVRDIVEATLADIESRGDAALRDLSIRFDKWDRADYRLSPGEIEDCLATLTPQDAQGHRVRPGAGPQLRADPARLDQGR